MFVPTPLRWLCLLSLTFTFASARVRDNGVFPKGMEFGVSTSAYQIEGAWNLDGKGESIWDTFVHSVPSPIANGETGDVACDSYHKYKEDVTAARKAGVKLFRFSFAWTRVLPTGYADQINELGVQHYRNLIEEIVRQGLIPVATLFHWDLPQQLFDDGIHWTNEAIIEHFVNYARIMIKLFPEVGWWGTINEPKQVCHFGYGNGLFAPGIISDGLDEYVCAKIALKAHAAVYRMYKKEFPHYKAKMAIANDCQWFEAKTDSPADIEAADRQLQFECGLYYHPIYKGDWPEVVKKRILARSLAEGYHSSRLPAFTPEEIEFVRGSFDYLALNHYYTVLTEDMVGIPNNVTSYNYDIAVINSFKPNWVLESNGAFTIVPYGFRKVLEWLKEQYGDIEIIVTEVGMTEDGSSLNDDIRIDFYIDYFCNMLGAIHESKVNVVGVIAWALLDNFEWFSGYAPHFGLYTVDFKDPEKPRIPKKSVEFWKKMTKTRRLYCDEPRRHWQADSDENVLDNVPAQSRARPFWHTGFHKF